MYATIHWKLIQICLRVDHIIERYTRNRNIRLLWRYPDHRSHICWSYCLDGTQMWSYKRGCRGLGANSSLGHE